MGVRETNNNLKDFELWISTCQKQNEKIYIDDFANYSQFSAQEITTLLSR